MGVYIYYIICIHIYIYVYVCVCVGMYIHIYICVCVCVQVVSLFSGSPWKSSRTRTIPPFVFSMDVFMRVSPWEDLEDPGAPSGGFRRSTVAMDEESECWKSAGGFLVQKAIECRDFLRMKHFGMKYFRVLENNIFSTWGWNMGSGFRCEGTAPIQWDWLMIYQE